MQLIVSLAHSYSYCALYFWYIPVEHATRSTKRAGDLIRLNILVVAAHTLILLSTTKKPQLYITYQSERGYILNVFMKIMQSMELHSHEMPKAQAFPQLYSSYKILCNNPLQRKHLTAFVQNLYAAIFREASHYKCIPFIQKQLRFSTIETEGTAQCNDS